MKFRITFINVPYLEKRLANPGYTAETLSIGTRNLEHVRRVYSIRNWWRRIQADQIEPTVRRLGYLIEQTYHEEDARNIPAFGTHNHLYVRVGDHIWSRIRQYVQREDGMYQFYEDLEPQFLGAWISAGCPKAWGCPDEPDEITQEKLHCAHIWAVYPRSKEDKMSPTALAEACSKSVRDTGPGLPSILGQLGLLDPMIACGAMGGLNGALEDAARRQLGMNQSVLMTTLVQDTFQMKSDPVQFTAAMVTPELSANLPISDPQIRLAWDKDPQRNHITTLLSPPHSPIQTLLAKMFLTAVPEDIPVYYLIELYYKTTDCTFMVKLYPTVKIVEEERSIVWKFRALVPTAPEVDKIELSRAPDYVRLYRMN